MTARLGIGTAAYLSFMQHFGMAGRTNPFFKTLE
jgi:hypothetical protein